jgi:serine/threonine protein kinase
MKIIKGQYSPIPTSYSSKIKSLVTSTLNISPQKRPTVTTVLKSISRNVLQYTQEYETELKKNIDCNASIDMERVELNNLKLQLSEMNIINGVDAPIEQPPTRPESKISVISSESEKPVRYPLSNQAPVNAPSRARGAIHAVEPSRHEVRMQHYEQKKQQYQKEIARIQNARADLLKKMQNNKLQEQRDKRAKEREEQLKIERQRRAEDFKAAYNQIKPEVPRQKQLVANGNIQNPQYKRNVEDLKQVQLEKEKVLSEVDRLERDIAKIQKGRLGGGGGGGSVSPRLLKKEPSNNRVIVKQLSDRDRVLAEKERKKKEEEERYKQKLQEERIHVHKQRQYAQQRNYGQYHNDAKPPAVPVQQPQQQVKNAGGIIRKYSFDDVLDPLSSDNNDELDNLESELLNVTRKLSKLEQIKTSGGNAEQDEIEEDFESDYEELEQEEEDGIELDFEEEDDTDDKVRMGRLGDRAKFIRKQCEGIFGKDLFEKVYAHVKNANDRNIQDENDQKKYRRLVSVLGVQNAKLVDYCHLIEELLFVEGSIN